MRRHTDYRTSPTRIAVTVCTAIPIEFELSLEGPIDPHTGFVVDFFDVEAAFNPLLVCLDHHCLNEVDGLENPTAENISVWIWDRVKPLLPQTTAVVVYETPNCWAEYNGQGARSLS